MSIHSQTKQIKNQLLLFFSIFIFTIFSLTVYPGYEVFKEDQEVYMPQIYHSQNHSLFGNDLLIKFDQLKYTFFDELVNFTQNFFNKDIFLSLFILMFITRFIYYFSIYQIALYFSQNKLFSFISLFLFMKGYSVYGYPYSFLETLLVPRFISLSLCLLSLVFLFKNKTLISFAILACASLVHPLTVIPFTIFPFLKLIFSFKKYFQKSLFIISFIIGLFILFSILVVKFNLIPNILILHPLDLLWENIIRTRNPYYFLSTWNYQLLILGVTFLLFIVLLMGKKPLFNDSLRKSYAFLFFIIPSVSLIIYFFIVEILKIPFLVQIQLLRTLVLWKIACIFFFSYYAYHQISIKPHNILFNFFLLGIVFSFIFESSFIFPFPSKGSLVVLFILPFLYLWTKKKHNLAGNSLIFAALLLISFILARLFVIRLAVIIPLMILLILITLILRYKMCFIRDYQFIIRPAAILIISMTTLFFLPSFQIRPKYFEDKLFMETCNWIKNHTNTEAIFITEPFTSKSGPLRLSCLRSIFTSRKDGSFAILFNRDYALEWQTRMNIVKELENNNYCFPNTPKEYKMDYILSERKLDLSFPEIYNNGKYFIYKINNKV